MSDPYKSVKKCIEDGDYKVVYLESAVPSTFALQLVVPLMPMPVTTVYYRHVGKQKGGCVIEILDSFTTVECRRIGGRTAIHKQMLKWWPKAVIFTSQGNEKSDPWLRKMGFKEHPVWGWYLGRSNRKGR